MDWADDEGNATAAVLVGGDDAAQAVGVGVGGQDGWQRDLLWPTLPPDHFDVSTQLNETVSLRPEVLGPGYHRRLRQGILGAMFLVALFGNAKVVSCLRRKWGKRGRMTVLSMNLALADLLVVLVTILGQLMWEVLDKYWYLSNAACKLYKVVSTFAITSSNYMLVAIAIDRHEAVLRPLNPFISAKNLALAAWAGSLLPSLPNIFVFLRHVTPEGGSYCVSKFYTKDLDHNFRKVYLMVILVMVFVSCQVLLLILYIRIYVTIWKQSCYFKSGQRGSSDGRRCNSLLPKAKTKTLNMTIVIVVTFFITNTPYVIQEMMMSFGNMNSINPNVLALFGIISASNSCFNPFIYLFFCPKGENRSPESYKVTFTRRSNTITSNPNTANSFRNNNNR